MAQEEKMGRINWGRVVLCGLVTGVVWGVVSAVVFPLVAKEFMAALPGGFGGTFPGTSPGMVGIEMISPLVLGIAITWLYASIRPRYGPGPKTAVVAGFALWFFGSWVDVMWAALGAVPLHSLMAPIATNLPIVLVAALAGAWAYKE